MPYVKNGKYQDLKTNFSLADDTVFNENQVKKAAQSVTNVSGYDVDSTKYQKNFDKTNHKKGREMEFFR